MKLNIITCIILWLVVTTGGSLLLMPYNISNKIVLALLFFNNLNVLIAICEIILGTHIKIIQQDYKKNLGIYKGKRWDCAKSYLFSSLKNGPFDRVAWSRMWSTYALFDPSYQNNESFGFFIDVGNGWTTIPPCILWNICMAYPGLFSPVFIGCIGMASYWQMCYGTIIYLLSYVWNKRYIGKSMIENVGFVGAVNLLWFFFPILAIYASYRMLDDGDFRIFELP